MLHTPNGWPASPIPSQIGVVTLTVPSTGETVGVREDCAPLWLYFLRAFEAHVQPIQKSAEDTSSWDEWGYFYRANRNDPSVISEHGGAAAVDINATIHPNGKRGTFTTAEVANLRAIYREINLAELVIEWGGDFHGIPDEMHHQLTNLGAVRRAIARLRIRSDGTVAPLPTPVPPVPPVSSIPEDTMVGFLHPIGIDGQPANAVWVATGAVQLTQAVGGHSIGEVVGTRGHLTAAEQMLRSGAGEPVRYEVTPLPADDAFWTGRVSSSN